jgi:hypothetical protein
VRSIETFDLPFPFPLRLLHRERNLKIWKSKEDGSKRSRHQKNGKKARNATRSCLPPLKHARGREVEP